MTEIILNTNNIQDIKKYGGRYKKTSKKGLFDEDVYMKKKNGKKLFIYKLAKDFYCISRRRGSYSINAYLEAEDIESSNGWIFYKGWMNWQKYDSVSAKILRNSEPEPQPKPESTDEDDENKPANHVVVYSKFYNINGGYSLKDGIYFNAEDNMYLYYKSCKWFISNNPNSSRFFMCSDFTEENSPENADWTKSGLVVKRHQGVIHDISLEEQNDLFCDKDFDANNDSLGELVQQEVSWIRGTRLQPSDSYMTLFHYVEPNDIMQGALGDCWLLAALSSIAEFPKYFQDKIFKTNKISENGKYDISLYDASISDWITVTIDDRIPCNKKNKWFEKPRPLFAQPNENELYILLLEKAFAKVAGSYSKLSGGYPALAWLTLTGCEELEFWHKNKNLWEKRQIAIGKTKKDPFNFQNMWLYGSHIKNNDKDLFNYMKICDENNYLVSAAICGEVMEARRSDGLVERHAYSVICVFERDDLKLVQLRNPWGNDVEWNGEWSDQCKNWKNMPKLRKELEHTKDDDGLFWMSWEDFSNIFDDIQICAINMKKT